MAQIIVETTDDYNEHPFSFHPLKLKAYQPPIYAQWT